MARHAHARIYEQTSGEGVAVARVLVIGSSNVDYTVRLDRLPQIGETVSGGEFYQSFGGKGANQAVAARRAGADVVLLTKVGADANGERIVAHLLSEGLPGYALQVDRRAATGVALITVDVDGRNMIAVAPGSNRLIGAEDIRQIEPIFDDVGVVLLQLEVPIPAVTQALTLARQRHVRTILNPAPAHLVPDAVLRLVDVLTPNETEVLRLTGLADPVEAARALVLKGVGTVIVTLGSKGMVVVTSDRVRSYLPTLYRLWTPQRPGMRLTARWPVLYRKGWSWTRPAGLPQPPVPWPRRSAAHSRRYPCGPRSTRWCLETHEDCSRWGVSRWRFCG